jgi:hypothetical protein
MVFLVLFLVFLLLASCYVIYNLYTKYQILEDIAQENVDFIIAIRTRVLSHQSYLKQLDRIGAFESDDEVGHFFKELKKIINDIAVYLEIQNKDDDNDDDENNNIKSKIVGEIGGF